MAINRGPSSAAVWSGVRAPSLPRTCSATPWRLSSKPERDASFVAHRAAAPRLLLRELVDGSGSRRREQIGRRDGSGFVDTAVCVGSRAMASAQLDRLDCADAAIAFMAERSSGADDSARSRRRHSGGAPQGSADREKHSSARCDFRLEQPLPTASRCPDNAARCQRRSRGRCDYAIMARTPSTVPVELKATTAAKSSKTNLTSPVKAEIRWSSHRLGRRRQGRTRTPWCRWAAP